MQENLDSPTAHEQSMANDKAMRDELTRCSEEAFGEGISGTTKGKDALAFLESCTSQEMARLIDDCTITQDQVGILAELYTRRQEAFA